MTMRLSQRSLTGTERTLVAVGTVRLASMFCTVRAGAPLRTVKEGSSLAAASCVFSGSLGVGLAPSFDASLFSVLLVALFASCWATGFVSDFVVFVGSLLGSLFALVSFLALVFASALAGWGWLADGRRLGAPVDSLTVPAGAAVGRGAVGGAGRRRGRGGRGAAALVLAEEVPPHLVDAVGVLLVALVHLVNEPLVGSESGTRAFLR